MAMSMAKVVTSTKFQPYVGAVIRLMVVSITGSTAKLKYNKGTFDRCLFYGLPFMAGTLRAFAGRR
ncbi:hypothetical protein [Pseudomonas sp. GWSMS-1]|uniref:hypothetical protein n=1 Tax=Pseudomonas sp. GWSMS-1 TaxID=3308997 RepID=UPI003CE9286D